MFRITSFIVTSLILLMLALPTAQMELKFIKERKLAGENNKKKLKPLTVNNILTGDFQRAFEEWFSDNMGFRGYLVRLDNQLTYKFFGDMDGGVVTRNLVGEGKMLYQKEYVKSYDGFDQIEFSKLDYYVRMLKRLQDYQKARGKAFLLVIGVTKASLYPEFIPKRYRAPENVRKTSNYETLLPLLKKYGINFFDTQDYFTKKKKTSKFSYFAPSAAHWGDVASCEVASEIMKSTSQQLGKPTINFTCSPVKIKKPTTTDLDLLRIANLYDSSEFQIPAAYPVTLPIKPEGAIKPKMLLIGDSFIWPLLRFLEWHKVYTWVDFHYYNNTNYHYPGGRGNGSKLRIPKEQWLEMLDKQDTVIIHSSVSRINKLGLGYLEEVGTFLDENRVEKAKKQKKQ